MSKGTKYTRELLADATQQCSSIDQVIAFLGTRPYGRLTRHLYQRFAHFGIDVSHFRSESRRGTNRPRPSREELRKAVAASNSAAATLRRLGRADNGRSRTRLSRWIADDGLDTSHFLGQAHMRGKPGPVPLRPPEHILVKREGTGREKTVLLRRALRRTGIPERCAECGTGPSWHGRPMTLEVDHVSGDRSDNRPENLRLLCPNCHAVTSTWCRGGSPRRRPRSNG